MLPAIGRAPRHRHAEPVRRYPWDGENDAGKAEAAMAPLQIAAADGLAVVVTRHERKAGGDVGDSGRGSTAFGGAVDIILAIRRIDGGSNIRKIYGLSRFDETPDILAIELTSDGYVVYADGPDRSWLAPDRCY